MWNWGHLKITSINKFHIRRERVTLPNLRTKEEEDLKTNIIMDIIHELYPLPTFNFCLNKISNIFQPFYKYSFRQKKIEIEHPIELIKNSSPLFDIQYVIFKAFFPKTFQLD